MSEKFGTIEYKGQVIILDEQAFQTSRLLNEYGSDLQYVGDGATYMDEWKARGHFQDGLQIIIFWHFEIGRELSIKGSYYSFDTLAEDYDWNNIHKIEKFSE